MPCHEGCVSAMGGVLVPCHEGCVSAMGGVLVPCHEGCVSAMRGMTYWGIECHDWCSLYTEDDCSPATMALSAEKFLIRRHC